MTELAPHSAFKSVLICVNQWLKKTHFSHRLTLIPLIFAVTKQMSNIRVIRVIRAIRDSLVLILHKSTGSRIPRMRRMARISQLQTALIFVDSKNHREVVQC